jgi:quercetin dioxygenase-like cupin family protein
MNTSTLSPCIVTPGEAVVYDQLEGEKIHMLLSGRHTADGFALIIDETPPGAGPPLHVHQNEDEIFYVLEGELTIQVGKERYTVPAGGTAILPRGVPHTFGNLGTDTVKSLVLLTPAGLENFFAEVEPLATQAEPDMRAIVPLATKYGIQLAGPPLAARPVLDE